MGAVLRDHNPGGEHREPLDIVAWRYECLVAAGYPVTEAIVLAERGYVDLHVACQLIERGASVEEALRILV